MESKPLILELDARPHRGTKDYPGGQIAMIRGSMKYRFMVNPCGRRVGKTVAIFFLWLEEMARKKGFYNAGYVATDHAKAKEFFEAFLKCMGGDPRINPASMVKRFSRDQGQDRWVEVNPLSVEIDGVTYNLNEGGRFFFWSGTPPHFESIQGFIFQFDRICIDEMQLQVPQLVTEVVVPMLMDGDGSLLITGHPKRGRPGNHLFQTYYNRGLSSNPRWAEYGSWNIPSEGNPYTKRATILAGRLSCLTKQEEREEYDGMFCEDGGAVFPNLIEVFNLKPSRAAIPLWFMDLQISCPMPGAEAWFTEAPRPRTKYVLGVDWGRRDDSTIISVFSRATNTQVAMFKIFNTDFNDQLVWLGKIRNEYNKSLVVGDGTGLGMVMSDILKKKYSSGYRDVKFTAASKEGMVRRAQILFKENLVSLIDVPDQREQFRLFMQILPKHDDQMGGAFRTPRYGHPVGEHDDFVDAFMLAGEQLSLAPRKRSKKVIVVPDEIPGTMAYILAAEKRDAWGRAVAASRIG